MFSLCRDALPKEYCELDLVPSLYIVLVKQVGSLLCQHPVHVASTGDTAIHHANNRTYL